MALTLNDLVDGLRDSRQHFLKHIEGLSDEQYDWKPYTECKSIRETLGHLTTNDRLALQVLETGVEPDWEKEYANFETDPGKLHALLTEGNAKLCAYLLEKHADSPLDTEISIFGSPMKLARGAFAISAEDHYHAGQVAYIRLATDPTWDYYAAIFNMGG